MKKKTFPPLHQHPLQLEARPVRFKPPPLFNAPCVNRQIAPSLHIVSGCRHPIISGLVTEGHKIACRRIMKIIEEGSLGG